jgi:type II secretory pathway component PulF
MGITFGKSKLSTADRIDFFKTLNGWMQAGAGTTSLSEAIKNTVEAYSHDEYASLAGIMRTIHSEVESGQTMFYAALAQSDLGFQEQELAVIEAAERSSQLKQALPSLVAALTVQHQGRKDLMMKMAGPLFIGGLLIIMSLGVLVIMLPLVIQPVIDRNAKALNSFPVILQWYWAASVWLRANPYLVSGIVAGLVIGFFCRNLPGIQPYWLKFTMWWGVTRKLIIGFNALIVAYFMPALLRSGMPTPEVLEQLAYCVNNPILRSLLLAAADDHRGGLRLSDSVAALPFRASFINAIVAGEVTGTVPDRVADLQEPYRIELERFLKQVAGTLKFIVMAILLPFFILSTYTSLVGPIFALMEFK